MQAFKKIVKMIRSDYLTMLIRAALESCLTNMRKQRGIYREG